MARLVWCYCHPCWRTYLHPSPIQRHLTCLQDLRVVGTFDYEIRHGLALDHSLWQIFNVRSNIACVWEWGCAYMYIRILLNAF
jgi:hypothetical protein